MFVLVYLGKVTPSNHNAVYEIIDQDWSLQGFIHTIWLDTEIFNLYEINLMHQNKCHM